ncbi:MAG: cytidylate kinase-like family protein [Deltaproteobacteria bacterium]|nr:MAG: cytidylate kinase-like family protein [Deltaproteobacteria bacterium]
MAIITISRGSYSKGKEVAESVAERLGYECISREVLLDASRRFNIPEMKLIRAIHDAPSILDRFQHSKQAYIAYIRSALIGRVKSDNVVYHGLAGHILLQSVPHVLKVRITASLEDRIAAEMARESITETEARSLIQKDDQERRRWTKSLYGVDPWDSSLYDLVIRIDKLTVADAVDFICRAAGRPGFKTTDALRHRMEDLDIACRVKASLVDQFFDVAVTSEYGNVIVYTKLPERHIQKLKKKAKDLKGEIEGINNLEVHAGLPYPPDSV